MNLLVFLLSVLVSGARHDGEKSEDTSVLQPWMFLSSKTPYYQQQLGEREAMPSHCRLVHINHLGK